MADEFKSPQPGTLLEMPDGWDVLYATAGKQPALTDERILQIAERHRNHVLTAQSGTRFDVIEHKDLVAFAREVERAVIRQQVMGLVETVARLKRENNQLHWEVANAKRERDVAEDRYEAIRAGVAA
ncbi:hypothetical protein [Hoeflea olei]|uniref:Uncharacterized protein n=1 Tax=Hoeflea olei TaxID=1480615 RepID=A0A1C1YRZ5_9HYPH|nr:hypothetical protein [Hoeflea olei]OCW56273.1 hypothetical protein AWJ14_19455 [Hoeflea olei]